MDDGRYKAREIRSCRKVDMEYGGVIYKYTLTCGHSAHKFQAGMKGELLCRECVDGVPSWAPHAKKVEYGNKLAWPKGQDQKGFVFCRPLSPKEWEKCYGSIEITGAEMWVNPGDPSVRQKPSVMVVLQRPGRSETEASRWATGFADIADEWYKEALDKGIV
jgi:hypothetical protein